MPENGSVEREREGHAGPAFAAILGPDRAAVRAHEPLRDGEADAGAAGRARPRLVVAPDKVQRVLLNLVENAVRHTRREGAVAVVVQTDTDHVVVAVEDDGAGLAPGAPQRMFERFWRDDDSRARGCAC